MTKLTAQFVRDLPFADGNQIFIVDSSQSGFGVRVGKTSKAYYAEGRVRGKPRRVTIGRTDKLSLPEARKLAMRALAEMAEGRDRNSELRLERAKLMTLSQAVEGWLDERNHRNGTSIQYQNTMQREFGDWYEIELRRITPNIFQDRFRQILKRTPSGAALAIRTFTSCWSWARADVSDGEGRPILPECPATIIKAKKLMPKPKRKQSYVSDWQKYMSALEGLETNSNRHSDAGDRFRIFMQLIARTGLRRNEAATLKWENVDMKLMTFTISADRAKNGEAMTLPMSSQTFELFERLRGSTEGQKYVWGEKPFGDPRKTLAAFRVALGWSINFHDLRRSLATIATGLGVQQLKISRLLNHSTKGNVTFGYQILSNPEALRKDVQDISNFIDEKSIRK